MTLYFLFFGFSRSMSAPGNGWRFNFRFEGIPLTFPQGQSLNRWVFNVGNFVAFVPFGVAIPLLYRCNFIKFISLFLILITMIEAIQMITGLGSFDVNDIIINTLGATVGYCSQRFVTKDRYKVKGIRKIIIMTIALSLMTFTLVSSINYYLKHAHGDIVALDQFALTDGVVLWEEPSATSMSRNILISKIRSHPWKQPLKQGQISSSSMCILRKTISLLYFMIGPFAGWTGYTPEACKRTELHVPEKLTTFLWGWPDKFLNRMDRADTRFIVVGGDGSSFSSGFDTPEDIERLPSNYSGGIWTNRIESIE